MRHTKTMWIVMAAACLAAGAQAQTTDLSTDVRTTAESILRGGEPDEGFKTMRHLVNLAARIAVEGNLPEAVRTKLDTAKTGPDEAGPLPESSVAALREAYAALNAGQPFGVPADVADLDTVRSFGRARFERSVAALEKERHEEAARELVGFILLHVTPIEERGVPRRTRRSGS